MCKKLFYLISFVLVLALVNNASAAVPLPWISKDIGQPIPGTADYNDVDGVFTVTGDGGDIWGGTDRFHYVYQPLSAERASLTARVLSIGGPSTNDWRKVGVMIRQALTDTCSHGFMCATPIEGTNNFSFQWVKWVAGVRDNNNNTQATNITAYPVWIRIVRSGTTISGYWARDVAGSPGAWTLQHSENIPDMVGDVYIGLAVTSHDGALLCTSEYDNVEIEIQYDAWDFDPPDGAVCMPLDTILSWKAGPSAAFHKIYLGEDPINMNYMGFTDLATTTYDPVLEYGKTYFWQIDEFNDPCTWEGEIQSFSTLPDPAIVPDCTLEGHWKLDDNTLDSSGYDRHGTVIGTPSYVDGVFDRAINLVRVSGNNGDYINIDGYKGVLGGNPLTISAWLRKTTNEDCSLVTWGNNVGGERMGFRLDNDRLRIEHGAGNLIGTVRYVIDNGEWHHVALTLIENARMGYGDTLLYLDGQDITPGSTDGDRFNLVANVDVSIGRRATNNDRRYNGEIDDVRIYSRTLTPAEIQELAVPSWAGNPNPANGATDVPIETELCWSAGKDAVTHKVYLGTDPAAMTLVDTLSVGTECHDPMDPALPTDPNLVASTTYYWQVIEVDAQDNENSMGVWSFTTVSGRAEPFSPVDEEFTSAGEFEYPPDSGIMLTWKALNIIPGATSDELARVGYFSDDFNDVNDRLEIARLGAPPFVDPPDPNNYLPRMFLLGIPAELYVWKGVPVPGTGLESLTRLKTYYWCCDETDYKGNTFYGDVWSFTVKGLLAFDPDPYDGELYVDPNALLTWSIGDGVGQLQHDVYIGTDKAAVENADATDTTGIYKNFSYVASYQCPSLAYETTFYWRIDEVWDRIPPFFPGTVYKGPVWSFTTLPSEILYPITMEIWRHPSITARRETLFALPNYHHLYPDDPNETHWIPNFDSEAYNSNLGDNYGGRIQGYLHIKKSGEYTFAIAADDDSDLFLSTDDKPWNISRIAYHNGSVGTYNWNWGGTPTRKSAPIYLEGGRKYYIKALWTEGGGGDHCMVAYYGPDQPVTPVNGNGVWVIPGSGSGMLSKLSPYEYMWASYPRPVYADPCVGPPVKFEWAPAPHAAQHDFYFGTAMADVENADATDTTGIYRGRYEPNEYGPIPLPEAGILFWRIDEVNDAGPDPGIWKGQVWHFRPPGAAGGLLAMFYHTNGGTPPNPPELAFQTFVQAQVEPIVSFWRADHYWATSGGSPDPNVNVNYFACRFVGHVEILKAGTYTFETRQDDGSRLFIDRIELRLRRDGNVNNEESSWSQGGMRNYSAPVYLTPGLHDIEMHMYEGAGGAGAELRWWGPGITREIIPAYYLWPPLFATSPRPADGAVVESRKPALQWRPGMYATSHEVYFSTNFDDVNDRNPLYLVWSGPDPCYPYPALNDPLELGQTYYWLVDESKGLQRWDAREVWSFTLSECLYVDGFEDYNDRRQLRGPWTDGYDTVVWMDQAPWLLLQGGTNGSNLNVATGVGSPSGNNATGPVLNGKQGMAFSYDGDGFTYVPLPGEEQWVYDTDANYSEIEGTAASLDIVKNWNDEGVKALSLSYQGHPLSDGGYSDYDTTDWPKLAAKLKGRGRDIQGRWDEFYFFGAYPFSIEGYVEAKVNSMDNTDPWAKAGVMMREKMTPYSKYAAVLVTPGQGVTFQYRLLENGPTTVTTKAGVTAPQYVRLERYAGGDFKALHSSDGSTWDDVNGPGVSNWVENFDMATDIHIGAAVTSHNATATCTADVNNLNVANLLNEFAWPGVFIDPYFYIGWSVDNIGTNAAEQMYVEISDGTTTALVENPDPNATIQTTWQEWHIDMRAFTNVNFNNVEKIMIGIGDKDDPSYGGGSGTLYIDDIRTCPPKCIPYGDENTLTSPEWVRRLVADIATPYDCFVDGLDGAVMASAWLDYDYFGDPLVGRYTFDANDANDSSAYGNDGTIMGEPNFMPGVFGKAIQFDGVDDHVVVGSVGVSGNAPRTIAGWVKADSLTIPNWTNVFGFTSLAAGGNLSFDINRRNYSSYCIHIYGWERDIMAVDLEWHHLAATYDGTTIAQYGDGLLIGSEGPPAGVLYTEDLVQMGKRGHSENYFPGKLDDVRIYDIALTEAEIVSIMDGSLGTVGSNVLHPLTSPAELWQGEAPGQRFINFRDYSILAGSWLTEELWPDIP